MLEEPEKDLVDIKIILPRQVIQSIILTDAARSSAESSINRLTVAGYLASSRLRRQSALADLNLNSPCLNILFDLYIADKRGIAVTGSDLSAGSGSPFSSGLRYVDKLVSIKLANRRADAGDKRKVYIEIDENARAKFDQWLDIEVKHLLVDLLSSFAPERVANDSLNRILKLA